MAKVLVVDDEPEILRAVKMVLSIEGHEVEALIDPQSALDRVATTQYDVVILDLMMPVITGEQMLLRFKEARPELPVILLSGTADLFDIERLMTLGARDYIEKPFDPARLLDAVHSAIDAK